jgi:putative transposase
LNGQADLTRWRIKLRHERAIFAIQGFFANCKAKKPGKKGYPQFKKHTRSLEYKTSGWKLSTDKRCLTFTDGFAAGTFKLVGSRDWHFYAARCERVRVVRRADGYGSQFCIDVERTEQFIPAGKAIGIDVGLNHFYTDSDGNTIPNPRYLRKSEKALKRFQKGISRKKKGSSNRKKAIDKLGRKHLYVSRQRKDFAIKTTPGAVK